jgi:pyridoxine kinase
MPTVLSVQSWVACGNVGNTAALFPLQRLGCETWSLNTVAFSNHTGYGKWRGAAVAASEIAALFEGIAELGVLPRCDAVLSGYLGDAETGPVLLDIVTRVKQANPRALFACDPVMGDVGPGWYVRAGVPEFYRDHALAVADVVTPNRFELEWLTGSGVSNLAEAAAAAAMLRRQGPGIVLVTSLELAAERIAVVGGRDPASADRGDRLRRCRRRSLSRLVAQR